MTTALLFSRDGPLCVWGGAGGLGAKGGAGVGLSCLCICASVFACMCVSPSVITAFDIKGSVDEC